jgi:NAD-reducing hydrogenase small subunit
MSFLDLDEWLFELAKFADVVFSPVADAKTFPEGVDVCLVEGAIANEDNLELVQQVRARSRLVVAFGDCAITGNVTALRNMNGEPSDLLQRIYIDEADIAKDGVPREEGIVPKLLPKVLPLQQVIEVDAYLPGCPPSATRIQTMLEALRDNESVQLSGELIRFGQGA